MLTVTNGKLFYELVLCPSNAMCRPHMLYMREMFHKTVS